MKVIFLTIVAMLAFAANSLLCRLALSGADMDPLSFTVVRLASGAALLLLIVAPRWHQGKRPAVRWPMVAMLLVYMLGFCFAYQSLTAATGALLLFGAVQFTMLLAAWRSGERLDAWGRLGVALAIAGLLWLLLPGLSAPDPYGAAFMVLAGVGWGFYSLLGRRPGDPLGTTANNFMIATPLALILALAWPGELSWTPTGFALAMASGALASGLGYVIWYAALKTLEATPAATVQLSVPMIAAAGGVSFLGEPVGQRLIIASIATLGGIALVLARQNRER